MGHFLDLPDLERDVEKYYQLSVRQVLIFALRKVYEEAFALCIRHEHGYEVETHFTSDSISGCDKSVGPTNGPKRRLKRRSLTVNPLRPNLFRLLRRRLVKIFLDSGLKIYPKEVCGVGAFMHSNPRCSSATRCRLSTRSRCGSHSRVAIDCQVPVSNVGNMGIFLPTVTSLRGEWFV